MSADPPATLACDELKILSASFCLSTEKQSKEVITKRVLTYIVMHWDEINTQSNPSSTAMSPFEHISLKVYSIILK